MFLVAVLGLAIERVRLLCFRAALDATAMRRALVGLLRAGAMERARDLVRSARPAWVAEVVWPLLDPERSEQDRRIDHDDGLMEVEAQASRGMRALRISGSIGSALGFVGAAIEINWIFNGDHGLRRLQAGLVENVGLGHAVLSIALGIATSTIALGSWGVLKNVARDLVRDCSRVVASVQETLDQGHAAPATSPDA